MGPRLQPRLKKTVDTQVDKLMEEGLWSMLGLNKNACANQHEDTGEGADDGDNDDGSSDGRHCRVATPSA